MAHRPPRYMYGERIRLIRLGAGESQREFGNRFGLARSTISGFERGAQLPPIRFWIALAIQFKISLDVMILFKDKGVDPEETFRKFARIKRIVALK